MLLWVFLGVYWVDRGGRTLQSPPVVFHTLVRLLGTEQRLAEQRLAEPGLKPWSLRHSRDALKADLCSLSGCCNRAALFIPQVRVYRAALMHFTYFFYFIFSFSNVSEQTRCSGKGSGHSTLGSHFKNAPETHSDLHR